MVPMSTPIPQKTSKFDYLVNVSEAAFQSMVIATIESFLVAGPFGKAGRLTRQRETFGLLWGYETTTVSKARCFNVEVAIVDANAERGHTSVIPSQGLETINKTLPTYWPNLKFLGDFHSHPWTARDHGQSARSCPRPTGRASRATRPTPGSTSAWPCCSTSPSSRRKAG